jgi:SAM-dependent methyltransferase
MNTLQAGPDWGAYANRYRAGEWRDRIFHDLVLEDLRRFGPVPTVLDIGCGGGLDGDVPLQRSLAQAAGRFIGIEPDRAVSLGDYFSETHCCSFEEAPLDPGSVDLAYAVMVLEHVHKPGAFWEKLLGVLAHGGVFWGFTVDARHPFSRFSLWADRLKVKNLYMDLVLGRTSGAACYRNYPTYYRANTPARVRRQARGFRSCEVVNFQRVGQWGSYLPRRIRALADLMDERSIRKGRPGTLLAVRVVK